MKHIVVSWILLGSISSAFALEGVIFHVSRKLRIEKDEPVAPKDYYIDLGAKQGIRIGDTFKAYREMLMVDDKTGDGNSLMRVELAEIKIMFIGEFDSIGRIERAVDKKDLPSLDYATILLGDRVVLKEELPTNE